ncbi:hypothetical protein L9F63_014135, partial [Diploptera punctata]
EVKSSVRKHNLNSLTFRRLFLQFHNKIRGEDSFVQLLQIVDLFIKIHTRVLL